MVDAGMLRAASAVILEQLDPTPLVYSEHFSRSCGAEVHLKLENLQRTGSFKIRGALNRLSNSREPIGPAGVVAASAGNHAQGVALAASRVGVPATIVMPENASISKQLATRGYGGRVVLHGHSVDEALWRAQAMQADGYTLVHPFDDPLVIAGQATVGMELLEQLDSFDEVWVPVGGGGLAAGITLAVKQTRPGVRIVGVQTEACPSLAAALAAGRPRPVEAGQSVADGIRVACTGELPLQILRNGLDEEREVAESEIALTMVRLLEKKKLLAEGAGAAALAALLDAPAQGVRDRRIVVIISGGNVDLSLLDRVLEMGLMHTGRILRFTVALDDRPGALAGLLQVIASQRANVLRVAHDRLSGEVPVGRTQVRLTLETRGHDQNHKVLQAVTEAGYATDRPLELEPSDPDRP